MAISREEQLRNNRRLSRQIVGAVAIVLIIIGLFTVLSWVVGVLRSALDDTERRQSYADRLYGLVMFDTMPFDDVSKVDQSEFLQAAIWGAVYQIQKRDNGLSDYERDSETGSIILPKLEVDTYLTNLLGPDYKITDGSFQTEEFNYTYDEEKQGYLVPVTSMVAMYTPEVEKISNLRLEHKVGERVLGTDPKTGKEVSVKIGRFGPLVQLGSTDSEEKPQFASLQKGQSVSDITLEEALKLFELPRTLGDYEGETVTVAIGRFGPYVKHGKMFVSVPKTLSPQTITLDEAVELIKNKAEAEKKRLVKTFDEEPEMEILNGPYGVYISYKKKNYKIPKDKDAAALSLDDCRAIIEEAANAPKKPRRTVRRTTKKS